MLALLFVHNIFISVFSGTLCPMCITFLCSVSIFRAKWCRWIHRYLLQSDSPPPCLSDSVSDQVSTVSDIAPLFGKTSHHSFHYSFRVLKLSQSLIPRCPLRPVDGGRKVQTHTTHILVLGIVSNYCLTPAWVWKRWGVRLLCTERNFVDLRGNRICEWTPSRGADFGNIDNFQLGVEEKDSYTHIWVFLSCIAFKLMGIYLDVTHCVTNTCTQKRFFFNLDSTFVLVKFCEKDEQRNTFHFHFIWKVQTAVHTECPLTVQNASFFKCLVKKISMWHSSGILLSCPVNFQLSTTSVLDICVSGRIGPPGTTLLCDWM